MLLGCPTSVRAILSTKVNKLQEGPSFADATKEYTIFGISFEVGEAAGCGMT
jgi:hypothetical protein